MISHPAERATTYPYPIYLNGMHVEMDRVLATQPRDDFESGRAFAWAQSDISWMSDLEATLTQMGDAAPGYPEKYHKLHLVEKIAFALCLEHPRIDECLALMLQQDHDPQMFKELAAVSQRLQLRGLPETHLFVQPVDTHGNLRNIGQLLGLGLASETVLMERALAHPQAQAIVPQMIKALEPEVAQRMRQQVVKALLVAGKDEAPRLRAILGLQPCMGTWEASRRFTLMFEYAAQGLLDEHQLLPEILSANLDAGIGAQISMLVEDRVYLKDMAQKDLTRMIERILQEALRYPNAFDPDKPPLLPNHIASVIGFCVDHVREGRDLITHALLPNISMGELYCPAPWESDAESRLTDLLGRIEKDLDCESHHARIVHQIGRLIIPGESIQ